jgi:lysophospholipase L1-like esterase
MLLIPFQASPGTPIPISFQSYRPVLTSHPSLSYTSTRLLPSFARILERATAPEAPPTLLFTIFLGANDACLVGAEALVPWPTFSSTIRNFIDTILTLPDTKIVLITPPPINIPRNEKWTQDHVALTNELVRAGQRYKTYMSKKRYAEGVMEIAAEYKGTGRVIGVDFWTSIVEEGGMGRCEEFEETGLWPGCGLVGAKSFEEGWFTDGLHLDRKGYWVLSKMLVKDVVETWPELASERL